MPRTGRPSPSAVSKQGELDLVAAGLGVGRSVLVAVALGFDVGTAGEHETVEVMRPVGGSASSGRCTGMPPAAYTLRA